MVLVEGSSSRRASALASAVSQTRPDAGHAEPDAASYMSSQPLKAGTSATSARSAAYWLTVWRTSARASLSSSIRSHDCSHSTRVTSGGRCSSWSC
jgi:hypothetical protein